MATLKKQMEQLQRQQTILAQKIKQEEERNNKLAQEASIERLEALIQPITQHLDWVQSGQNGVSHSHIYRSDLSARQNINKAWEQQRNQQMMHDPRTKGCTRMHIKFGKYPILGNEEIFVTLLGIIKKQDERISQLEAINK